MTFQESVAEITPTELKKKLEGPGTVVVLDVREPHEVQICTLANAIHIPLGQLEQRLKDLDRYKEQEIIVYCRSGKRSEMACGLLQQHGFKTVTNLQGGILQWSNDVEPSMQKY